MTPIGTMPCRCGARTSTVPRGVEVLREYLAVVTRPGGGSEPLAMAEALADIEFAAAVDVLEDGPEVGGLLGDLCRSFVVAGRQVHDANIVATMLAHRETRLLTAKPQRLPALRAEDRGGRDLSDLLRPRWAWNRC